jgi:hypothetical protein
MKWSTVSPAALLTFVALAVPIAMAEYGIAS